jgi:hypothetical protein
VLRTVGFDIKNPANRRNLAAASVIDTVVRTRRRHAFLLALAESGLEVHICGEGWEPNFHRFKNATYHGPVDMTRMVELMRQSRVVLTPTATSATVVTNDHSQRLWQAQRPSQTSADFTRRSSKPEQVSKCSPGWTYPALWTGYGR